MNRGVSISVKKIMYGVLFLCSLYFMRFEAYLLVILFGMTLIYTLTFHKGLFVSVEYGVLISCFLWYHIALCLLTSGLNTYTIIRVLLGPAMGYFIGAMITDGENDTIKLIITIALGNILYGSLNLFSTTSISWVNRSVLDIWTKTYNSATLQSSFFTAGIGIVLWLFRYNLKRKILSVIIIAIGLYNAIMTSTRTTIMIIAISLLLGIYVQIWLSDKKERRVKRFLVVTSLLVVFIIIGVVLYNQNFYGIKSLFESSNLYTRVTYEKKNFNAGFSRTKEWMAGLKNISDHPLGMGDSFQQYAHNFWIDTGMEVGIGPCFLLFAYTVCISITAIKFLKSTFISGGTKLLVLGTYMAYFMNFMIEPIFEAVPMMVISFFMINGSVNKLEKLSGRVL